MMNKRILLAVGSVVGGLLVAVGAQAPAIAGAGTAQLVNEPFTGSAPTSGKWVLPAATAGTNDACLTTSTPPPTPPLIIPTCSTAGAAAGLQLTTNSTQQEGGLVYRSSVPSSLGLDVTFKSYQYNGNSADGIVFFLAASDPNNASASPITLGPTGGYLGYSTGAGASGLTNGYLGVGLDAYGNFSSSGFDGSGCQDSNPYTPESVDVRGAGSGTVGYCLLSTQAVVQGSSLDTPTTPQAVPVEVQINPTGAPINAVPAHSYLVTVTPIGAQSPVIETGTLPNASQLLPNGWTDAAGVPLQLSFGWSAATGDAVDFHTISNVNVSTLNGTPPVLTTTLADGAHGVAQTNQIVNYTVTPSVTAANETRTITLTDTFPAGLTPQAPSTVGTNWTCNLTGQTVTCTYPPSPIGALPDTLTIPAKASVTGPLSDTVTVGSPDAVQGSATDVVQYSAPPTATALVFGTEPVNAQLNTAMPTAVKVDADVTASGPIDTTYNGPVTLSFANNPGAAKFGTGASATSTLTANAVNGVATFSSIVVNAVGFGYTLQASAPSLSAATSTSFDVNAATTTCAAGQTCTVTTTSTATNQSAQIQAQPGSGTAQITASFGGNVAPIHPCTGATAGILTFSGNRQKLITLTMTNLKLPMLLFCYGQPTPFKDITLRPTTYFNTVNQDYEGLLPLCLLVPSGNPCVKSISLNLLKKTETVVISSGAADPHIMT